MHTERDVSSSNAKILHPLSEVFAAVQAEKCANNAQRYRRKRSRYNQYFADKFDIITALLHCLDKLVYVHMVPSSSLSYKL